MRSTFIVSDLHLVDPTSPRDPFAYKDRLEQFNLFLDFVEKQAGNLILGGDVLDLWRGNFSKAVKSYDRLLRRLAGFNPIYVVGNHDCDLLHFVGTDILNYPLFKRLSGPFTLAAGDKRVKIQHGHEADPYCADDMPGTGRISAIVTAMIEQKNGGPVRHGIDIEDFLLWPLDTLVGVHQKIWGKMPRDKQLTLGLKTAVDSGECDVVVGGHTHGPGHIGNWYHNNGSWCTLKPNSFTWIAGDCIQVWDWVKGMAVPNHTEL